MKTTIAVAVCVVIEDDDNSQQVVRGRNPLDYLLKYLRRETQRGRETVDRRASHGAEVA